MTRQQYRAAIAAQRKQENVNRKLIHLLINFRSYECGMYPYSFAKILPDLKSGAKLMDYDGFWLFCHLEGSRWNAPNQIIARNGNKPALLRPLERSTPF